jgi:acetoin utilization deacetylase AcuC-like enzyme
VALGIPVVWSEDQRLHAPEGEVWVGVRTLGTEVPERTDRILAELERAGAPIHAGPLADPDTALAAVHDPELLAYLASAWAGWEEAGLPRDPGQDRVVPYVFPVAELFPAGVAPALPAAASARAGRFAYDTMTLIGPGTWEAARAAAATAVTAAELVLGGERATYACCRPPGHHATRAAFGGSCYLNNAAVAAARLREAGRVAVVDVDAHHGNGTQSIFYEDAELLVGSVHVDPGAGWFPHFLGFATETGAGPGAGANRNLPLAPGSGDERWLAAVGELAEWAAAEGAAALVVALGVDAAGGDPESPLEVSAAGFRAAGRALGALGLPTVLVQEGGYDLETLGPLVLEVLTGLEEAG